MRLPWKWLRKQDGGWAWGWSIFYTSSIRRPLSIGGSAGKLGNLLLDPARAIIREHILHDDFYYDGLIRPATFSEDVCLIGAALYAMLRFDATSQ